MNMLDLADQEVIFHIENYEGVTSREFFDELKEYCHVLSRIYGDDAPVLFDFHFELKAEVGSHFGMDFNEEVRLENVVFENVRDVDGTPLNFIDIYHNGLVDHNVSDLYNHMKTFLEYDELINSFAYELFSVSEMNPNYLNGLDTHICIYKLLTPSLMPILGRFVRWKEENWDSVGFESRMKFIMKHGYKYDKRQPNFFENAEQFI